MERYKYLIVGGGMTADSAVRGIGELDGAGSIGLISAETVDSYDRLRSPKPYGKKRTWIAFGASPPMSLASSFT